VKLEIVTPLGVAFEASEVEHVLAEDASGLFGIRRGHAEFVTVLRPSVLSWRLRAGGQAHAALRGGVLYVRRRGREEELVEVATREAIVSEDLQELEALVESSFRDEAAAEEESRAQAARMQVALTRGVWRYLHPEQALSAPPALGRKVL